jgi:pimeloyl-ACP methyl ester carboxylesterase
VWERVSTAWAATPAADRRVVVFVHGATWSGRPDFDLQIRDYSIMEHFADAGWGAYAIDIQGYGASDDPVGDNWSEAKDGALDIHAAVELICEETGVERVHVVGWSWGCQTSGLYAQSHPERVAKLVFQGGHFKTKYDVPDPADRLRTNDATGAASDFIEGCFEQDVVDAYVADCLKHDPTSPNGVRRDFARDSEHVLAPEELAMPLLVVLGEHEVDDARVADLSAFFARLASRHKRFLVLPGGGHAILLEKPHVRWQNEVRRFLEEDWD